MIFNKLQKREDRSDGCNAVRFDRGTVGSVEKRSDGSLLADAIVTRSGIFKYLNSDGTVRRELRHPDHIFRLDSLETMKMIPVTNDHPSEFVTPDNVKQLKVGHTGENIRPDGVNVRATLVIDAKDGLTAIEGGRKELSLGYETELVREDGVWQGERYDYIQTNIRYNHLALVDRARAGKEARLNIDGYTEDEIGFEIDEKIKNKSKPKKGGTMPQIVLDGCTYEAPQEVINAHAKQKERADSAEATIKETKANLDAKETEVKELNAKCDGLKDEVEKAKNLDHSEEIDKRVAERVDLLDLARCVLDSEELKEIEKKTDSDIKKAIILHDAKDKEALSKKLDSYDDACLNIRFDVATENIDRTAKKNDGKDVSGQRKQSTSTKKTDSKERTASDARQDMIDRITNAHNKKEDK